MFKKIKPGSRTESVVWGCLSFIGLVLLWQVLVIVTGTKLFPGPFVVLSRFFEAFVVPLGPYTLVGHVLWSLSRVLVGYTLAAVLGITLGLTMGWFPVVQAIFLDFRGFLCAVYSKRLRRCGQDRPSADRRIPYAWLHRTTAVLQNRCTFVRSVHFLRGTGSAFQRVDDHAGGGDDPFLLWNRMGYHCGPAD